MTCTTTTIHFQPKGLLPAHLENAVHCFHSIMGDLADVQHANRIVDLDQGTVGLHVDHNAIHHVPNLILPVARNAFLFGGTLLAWPGPRVSLF